MEQKMREYQTETVDTGKVVAFEKTEEKQQDVNVNFMKALLKCQVNPIQSSGAKTNALYRMAITKIKTIIAQKIALQLNAEQRAKDTPLYSIFDCAEMLNVHQNTIQKAYKELMVEEYIYSIPGRGYFLSPNARKGSEKADSRAEQIIAQMYDIVIEFFIMGVDLTTIQSMLADICNGSTVHEVHQRYFCNGAKNPHIKKLISLMEEGKIDEGKLELLIKQAVISD